jgi:DNA invertase Pin-like site-specific DNA recombinase
VRGAVVTEKAHPKPYGSPVVGYVRSARRGDPALDQAEAKIRAYCAEQGWNLTKVYREEGVSSVAAWRPQFEEMVRGLERREWVGVVLIAEEQLSTRLSIRKKLQTSIITTTAWVRVIAHRSS